MKTTLWSLVLGVIGLGGVLLAGSPAQTGQPPDQPPDQGVEVQARGMVHEAFAEPVDARPEPGSVVPKQPPDRIEEMPPDQKPEGDNVQWVPGYWGWDDSQNNYLWISGFWRNVPPGRQWVPGHWQQVEGGWQWTPGFWAPIEQAQVDYLPAPPPPVEAGPSTPPPDDTSAYVPGTWVHQQTRYVWRPGFWLGYRPGWVWIPAHYVWTPVGYLFVEGYWDFPLCDRGLLFAPVVIRPELYLGRRWVYTPSFVVQPDFLLSALFVRQRHHHYYFGDYFEAGYAQRGFVPWVDYRQTRFTYDPNYAYYRHLYARDPRWEQNLRALYVGRREGTIPRPPATLALQRQVINNITINKTANTVINNNINITHAQNVQVLTPLNQVHNTRVTALAALGAARTPPQGIQTVKLQPLPTAERTQIRDHMVAVHKVAQERQQTEAKMLQQGATPQLPTDRPKPAPLQMPKPPAPPAAPPVSPGQPVVPHPGLKQPPPPPPPTPKHEDRPIPKHEPPPQSKPPRPDIKPPEPPKPPAAPPKPPEAPKPPPPKPPEAPKPPPPKPPEAPKPPPKPPEAPKPPPKPPEAPKPLPKPPEAPKHEPPKSERAPAKNAADAHHHA